MKETNIVHIKENQTLYKIAWYFVFLFWIYLLYLGFKYIPYTFLVELPIVLISFWVVILILTGILAYSFVWIFFIDKILGPEATKKRKERS